MNVFCTDEFKTQFEKLKKKNSYSSVEGDMVDYFFDKTISELSTGTRLNNSDETPYIKKRLNGSGGFRVYYLLLIKKDNLYLMFLHPKTGSMGYENITDESKALLYKQILERITSGDLYKVEKEQSKLKFTPLPAVFPKN